MMGKSKTEHGFTLLEVIVAIVIITTLTAAFAPLIASSVRNIRWAGERMQWLYSVRGQMERAVASLDGVPITFVIKGPSDEKESRIREWEVEGVVGHPAGEDSSQGLPLVSFVLGQEKPRGGAAGHGKAQEFLRALRYWS